MDQVLAPHSLRDRHGRGICISATPALTGCACRRPRLTGGVRARPSTFFDELRTCVQDRQVTIRIRYVT